MATIQQWSHLTSPELARISTRDPIALLPTAAIEQHGPHLPLATDVIIGTGIVERAVAELASGDLHRDILLLPCIAPGASVEHTHFPGTLSLDVEQMIAQVCAIGQGVARAGIRRLAIFNSHGGNIAAIDAAALRLRAEQRLLVAKAHYFRFALPDDLPHVDSLRREIHGGLVETSMMLHLAPEQVHPAAFADRRRPGDDAGKTRRMLGPQGEISFAWMAEDLHPDGVAGDTTAASATLGEQLVSHYGHRLAEGLEALARFDLRSFGK